MEKRLSNFYLVIAIIGIITAIPVLGSIVDFYKILTLVLLGFSIYVLVKHPKGTTKKTAAILMIISCVLTLIAALIFVLTIGGVAATSDMSSYETGEAAGALIGGSLLTGVFAFPAWILKIIAIVFAFKASGELKRQD